VFNCLYILSFVFYPCNCHRLISASCKPFLSVIIIIIYLTVLRLCLYCDYRNCGSTAQANHNFPDQCHIPRLFQVFEVGGHPVIKCIVVTLLCTERWVNWKITGSSRVSRRGQCVIISTTYNLQASTDRTDKLSVYITNKQIALSQHEPKHYTYREDVWYLQQWRWNSHYINILSSSWMHTSYILCITRS